MINKEPNASLQDACSKISRDTYRAVSKHLESLELKGLIAGNGHHAAQKIAEIAVEELKARWKDQDEGSGQPRYRMLIQWSLEDKCFVVGLPDFPGQEWRAHGATFAEAVSNGQEALDALILSYQADNESLPELHGAEAK